MSTNLYQPVLKNDMLRPAIRGTDVPELMYDLFHFNAPHGAEDVVRAVILKFMEDHVPKWKNYQHKIDEMGNMFIKVPGNDKIMFSCHMDTVVHPSGHTKAKPLYLPTIPLVTKDGSPAHLAGFMYGGYETIKKNEIVTARTVLGGDDKAGCYALCRMIQAGIPGLYAFHVGEEQGCVGSKYASNKDHDVWSKIKACVAVDRRGYTDIIAFQRSSRTASSEFTKWLAAQLNANLGPTYAKFSGDVYGAYTDSAEYADDIAECSNISCGYDGAHGDDESFDFYWMEKFFLPALLSVDWKTAAIARDPKKTPTYESTYYRGTSYTPKPDTFNGAKRNIWYDLSGSPLTFTELKMDQFPTAWRLPEWFPKDGLNAEISVANMKKVISINIARANFPDSIQNSRFTKDVYDMVMENDMLYQEVFDKEEVIAAFLKFVREKGLFDELMAVEGMSDKIADAKVLDDADKIDDKAVVVTSQILIPAPAARTDITSTALPHSVPLAVANIKVTAIHELLRSLPPFKLFTKEQRKSMRMAMAIIQKQSKLVKEYAAAHTTSIPMMEIGVFNRSVQMLILCLKELDKPTLAVRERVKKLEQKYRPEFYETTPGIDAFKYDISKEPYWGNVITAFGTEWK